MAVRGYSGDPMSEINVTPFVDVMLVLLVIFMVTAPLITTGVEVDLPNAKAQVMEVDESKLVLSIDKSQKVFLGKTEIPSDKLESTLLANERLKTEKELYLQADENVPYGFVVKVMAIIKRAGIEQLGMITDSMETDETAQQ